jgi:uncharacterized membrane protein (DUF4010 family)
MLYPRVLAAVAILNPALIGPLVPYFVVPAALAFAVVAMGARDSASDAAPDAGQPNPLQLISALQMAALFQAVLMIVVLVRQRWGTSGIMTTASVLGLTDVDALTISMTRDVAQSVSPSVAAAAIAVGVLANTTMKLAIAIGLGSRRFRLIAGAVLAGMLVALAAALVFLGL